MDWFLYCVFLLYLSTQSALHNVLHSPIHTITFSMLKCFLYTTDTLDASESILGLRSELQLFSFFSPFLGPISINQVTTSTAYQQARTVTNVDLIYVIIIQFETKKDFMTKWTEIIGLWMDEYKTPYKSLEDTFCKQWYRKTSTACAKIFMQDKDSLHQSNKQHRFWSSVQHTTI